MENSRFFSEIQGNFGFGCMRLPMKAGNVDYKEFSRMADAFIEAGFNYFDTAHGYINITTSSQAEGMARLLNALNAGNARRSARSICLYGNCFVMWQEPLNNMVQGQKE